MPAFYFSAGVDGFAYCRRAAASPVGDLASRSSTATLI